MVAGLSLFASPLAASGRRSGGRYRRPRASQRPRPAGPGNKSWEITVLRCARTRLQRKATSPVRDRSQEETGHYRRDIAEEKLMRVPGNHAISGREAPRTEEQSDPQDHGDTGPHRRAEEKRREAVTQQWYRLWPKPRNAATRLGTAGSVLIHDHEIGLTSPNVN
jgi:hypothetical protein